MQVGIGYSAQWSPDGKHISFVRDCEVHVVPFDGADTGGDGVTIQGSLYEWRDDGNLLVHQSSEGRGAVDEMMAIYDSAGKQLVSYPEAILSPNGDLIATTTGDTVSREWTTTIRATGSGQVLRTLDDVNHVTFSPNGRWIAYDAATCCGRRFWILDVATPGSAPRLVTSGADADWPVWSPDSQKLAFVQRAADESGSDLLVVFDVRNGNLTTIGEDATIVQWFPHSERLLFVVNPG